VGDERFFDFLRQYAQDNAANVATGTDFWRAYASVGGDSAAIRAVFFGQP
jgi:aminopeptidase N